MIVLRRAFVGASVLWAAALPLATLAASRPQQSWPVYALTFAVYAIGSIICHQLPGRSFHVWSHQMPVCARCTGIYAGAALAAVMVAIRRGGARSAPGPSDSRHIQGPSKLGPYTPRVVSFVAIVPTLATLVFEWTTGQTPSNGVRAASGLPLGAAVSWIVMATVATPARERDRATRREVN